MTGILAYMAQQGADSDKKNSQNNGLLGGGLGMSQTTQAAKPLGSNPLGANPVGGLGGGASGNSSSNNSMAGNVAGNLNQNGLLMQTAAAKGRQYAAARGLQNSTLGAEASQRAMIDAAMPIAQIDTTNQHQAQMQQTQNQFAAGQSALDRTHQAGMQAEDYRQRGILANLGYSHEAQQAQLNRAHQQGMQTSQNQFAAGQSALDRTHQAGMQAEDYRQRGILANLGYSHEAQQAQLNRAHQQGMQTSQNQFAAGQSALDRTHQRGMQTDDFIHRSSLANVSHQRTAEQAELDRSHQLKMQSEDYKQRGILQEIARQAEMEKLGAEVRANTIGKSIDFLQQIAGNYDAQISAVLNNTNMPENAKTTAINELKASRDSEIRLMRRFFNRIPTAKKDWAIFPDLVLPQENFD